MISLKHVRSDEFKLLEENTMNKETYVKEVIKKLECSQSKKKEIKQKLESDLEGAIKDGETLTDIIERMGTAKETAKEFNETFSDEEKKKAKYGKTLKVIAIIAAIVVALLVLVFNLLPKTTSLSDSKIFTEEAVSMKVLEVIETMDQSDYDSFFALSGEELVSAISEQDLESVKAQIATDWGNNNSIGKIYCYEITQMGTHYAGAQVSVEYDHVNVIYTMSFDEDMRLVGFYIK